MSKKGLLGVDLGGTNIRAALLDENGRLIYRTVAQHGEDKNPHVILQNTKAVVATVLNQNICRPYIIESLGIGVPGSVDKSGIIIKAPNLGWENIDFQAWLSQEYPFPVSLANDITMAVWGEYCFGDAQNFQDVIFIALGTGVGGGFIIDGKLFSGHAESCVETGHMVLEADGELCGCGSRGCWETIVSGSALKRAALKGLSEYPDSLIKILIKDDLSQLKAEIIYQAYLKNDYLAGKIWRRFVNYLAYGLNNIIVLFNPQVLVLGGGVTSGVPQVVEEVREVLKKTIKIFNFNAEKIIPSRLGEDAGLIGAAFYGRKYGQN